MSEWPATFTIQEICDKYLFYEDNGIKFIRSHVRKSEIQHDAYIVDLKDPIFDFEEITKIDKELRKIGYRIKYVNHQPLLISYEGDTTKIEPIKFELRVLPIRLEEG
jgi:hypothetical protein